MTAPRFTIRDGVRPVATAIARPREGRVDLDTHGHLQALSGEEAVRFGREVVAAGEAVIAERAKTGAAA